MVHMAARSALCCKFANSTVPWGHNGITIFNVVTILHISTKFISAGLEHF
jgi:hypothetical protein